jgi:hypothetical protein
LKEGRSLLWTENAIWAVVDITETANTMRLIMLSVESDAIVGL